MFTTDNIMIIGNFTAKIYKKMQSTESRHSKQPGKTQESMREIKRV